MPENFGVFSFLRSWKLTRFLTTCMSASSFKIWTLALFCISLKLLERIFLKSLHITFIIYRLKLSLRLIHCTTLKFHDKPTLRTGQKSALQHSPFWRYANFPKLMRTIYISMTGTFQCEYCQCLAFKRCDKFKLKCTSHGVMNPLKSQNFSG